MNNIKKIIMDCDPGHDDAIALLLATRAENLEVLGVTTVAGNSEVENTTRNALRVLNYSDVCDIPVYAGCAAPMMRKLYRLTGAIIHGEDGLGGPAIPAPVQKQETIHAVDYLIRTLRAADEKIIVIATGPLTNVATAFVLAPDVKEKIDRLIIMGGAVTDAGNITSAAEFNIFVDPEAAKIVFNSGVPIYLNTLDVSMKAVFYEADILALGEKDNKVSRVVCELLKFFAGTHVDHFGFMACPIHDALCVGILLDEDLVGFQHVFCDISLHDELTLGETVADLWNITGKEPNVYLSRTVDREKFVTMITEYMQRPYISNVV